MTVEDLLVVSPVLPRCWEGGPDSSLDCTKEEEGGCRHRGIFADIFTVTVEEVEVECAPLDLPV